MEQIRPPAGGNLARRKGFEPLTPRFEVWCSIQLSYRRSRPILAEKLGGRDAIAAAMSPRPTTSSCILSRIRMLLRQFGFAPTAGRLEYRAASVLLRFDVSDGSKTRPGDRR